MGSRTKGHFLSRVSLPVSSIVVAGIVLLNISLVRSDAYKDSLARALSSSEVQNVLGS